MVRSIFVSVLALLLIAEPATAQSCRNSGNFSSWLDDYRQYARAQGISSGTVSRALRGITFNQSVIDQDRRQRVFSQSFLQFSDRMVVQYRLDRGRGHIRNKNALFSRIERQYGVPAPVLVGFWGLETDFGANIGNMSVLRSLATLAYDCRRPERFRGELLAALRIVDQGDLTPEQMVGPWAGEMGQTQFLASHYDNYGVDFDGDGRRDLLRSSADALASAANLLKASGWRRGEPWLEEVKVPADMPWEQTGLDIRRSRSDWRQWGVTYADGRVLPSDRVQTALLLPMGRNGPAFLAYRNFDVYLEWNQSFIYSMTAAYYATRLAGAPRVGRGRAAVTPLSYDQTKDLQRRLTSAGYDVGGIDGTIGARTRAAVRAMQLRLGMPADSYPTAELLRRMN